VLRIENGGVNLRKEKYDNIDKEAENVQNATQHKQGVNHEKNGYFRNCIQDIPIRNAREEQNSKYIDFYDKTINNDKKDERLLKHFSCPFS